ncbi:MAG: hypothetical protein QOF15_1518 [Mycobacterium sp.]|nr:hypothetical protein [Mycobacterium sp.]
MIDGKVIMAGERRGGPAAMSADELAAFLHEEPTGAICVTDADGQLLALPAGVLGQEGNLWKVEIDGLDEPLVPEAAVCVVADRFPSYEAIRGVIAQGSISSAEHAEPSHSVVAVAVARTVTFSFANVTT